MIKTLDRWCQLRLMWNIVGEVGHCLIISFPEWTAIALRAAGEKFLFNAHF
jgi:hypothetical protein